MNLSGKVALITGGAQGLGRAFAEALLRRGAKVSLADVNAKTGNKAASELNEAFGSGSAIFVFCDVTSAHKFEDAFIKTTEVYKRIDILVNNAGLAGEENWRPMINVNVCGVVQGCMLGLKYMGKEPGDKAVIINIASTAGLTPVWFEPVYAGTKYAVVGYTRSLADSVEMMAEAPSIRVVCLCPSFTKTQMVEGALIDNDLVREQVGSLGVMEPEDVSRALIRLLDDVDNNGGIMHVTPKGMKYKYPHRLQTKGKL